MDKSSERRNFWAFILIASYILAVATILAFQGKPTEMGLTTLLGAIVMAFLNIDKIESFRGAGFEARMKQVVSEANDAIEKTRELGAVLARQNLDSIALQGRFEGNNKIYEDVQRRDEIVLRLRELGVAENKIDEATQEFNQHVERNQAARIRNMILERQDIPTTTGQEVKDLSMNLSLSQVTSPEEFRNIFAGGVIPAEIDEAIEDYRYFREHKSLRRAKTAEKSD